MIDFLKQNKREQRALAKTSVQEVPGGSSGVPQVLNSSGSAADIGDVGYIDEAGEYQTTTTASDVKAWCVVVAGGADNENILVVRQGRWAINYTGTAPAAGNFLVTSTTAGSAARVTTMEPAVFAVCMGAG